MAVVEGAALNRRPATTQHAPGPPFATGARLEPRETAYTAVFGAGALLLPVLFHALQLGRWFLPMYLPLFALAFLVRPLAAAGTAAAVPWISALLTGMPPLYPPVALWMSLELAATVGAAAWWSGRRPTGNPAPILLTCLLAGRFIHVGLVWITAYLMELPAGLLAGLSLSSGWPGVLLICGVVPPVVQRLRSSGKKRWKPPAEATEP